MRIDDDGYPWPTDGELVRASRAGDQRAFGRLVERYQAMVCAVALGATRDVASSEEIAQEAFVVAWSRRHELADPDKFRPWLRGITRNLARLTRRQLRRHAPDALGRRDEVPDLAADQPSPADRLLARETATLLDRALHEVPERYRVPLILFYRESQSIAQVARALDLGEDAVKQRLSRGRRHLRQRIEEVQRALAATRPGKAFGAAVLLAVGARGATAGAAPIALSAGAKALAGVLGGVAAAAAGIALLVAPFAGHPGPGRAPRAAARSPASLPRPVVTTDPDRPRATAARGAAGVPRGEVVPGPVAVGTGAAATTPARARDGAPSRPPAAPTAAATSPPAGASLASAAAPPPLPPAAATRALEARVEHGPATLSPLPPGPPPGPDPSLSPLAAPGADHPSLLPPGPRHLEDLLD